MAKHANGEGSVYRRKDGRWEAAVVLEGHRFRAYGATREAVNRQLVAALRSHQDGTLPGGGREAFGHFWEVWLPGMGPLLRSRTWRRYEELGRIHLLPTLGRVRLSQMGPQHVREVHRRMLEVDISPTTVHHAHAVLHRALADAVRWGIVSRNVAGLVRPPRIAVCEMKTLSAAESRALCRAAAGSRYDALYVLAVSTGMRQGELLALKWSAVDLERGVLQVNGTVSRTAAGLSITPPKTARSRRAVVLASQATAALERHRVGQAEERTQAGDAWQDLDLVFTTPLGGLVERDQLVRGDFLPLLRQAGLPLIRFHDLRHTAATLLLSQGVHPKVASEMLGHATVAITLDRYSHVTETMQRAAAESISHLLGS
ncbi:MAG: tyrosine-type recombinase/integrase [Candidatus Dormibacteria bacterium]